MIHSSSVDSIRSYSSLLGGLDTPQSGGMRRSLSNSQFSRDAKDSLESASGEGGSHRTASSERFVSESLVEKVTNKVSDCLEIESFGSSSGSSRSALPVKADQRSQWVSQARGEMSSRDDLSCIATHVLRTQLDEVIADHPQPWLSCCEYRERRRIISDTFFSRIGNKRPLANDKDTSKWAKKRLQEGQDPILGKDGAVVRRPGIGDLIALFPLQNDRQELLNPGFCVLAAVAIQVIADFADFEFTDLCTIWGINLSLQAIVPRGVTPPDFARFAFYREQTGFANVSDSIKSAYSQAISESMDDVCKIREYYNKVLIRADVASSLPGYAGSKSIFIQAWRLDVAQQKG